MSLQELIDGFQYLFDKIYSTEVLRKRFQNAKEILGIKNMNAAMFAFRVNLDWQNVYQHLIQNLKELQSSGFYDEALKKYNQYKKADKNIELTPVGA